MSKYAKFCIYYIYYNYMWCDAMSEVVGYAQNGSCCFWYVLLLDFMATLGCLNVSHFPLN